MPATSDLTFRDVLRRPTLTLWCLFLFFQPFYVFQSGLPQPGDLLLLPLFLLTLASWNLRLSGRSVRAMRALLWFTLWVFMVHFGWILITGEVGFLRKDAFSLLLPLFYIFNASVLFVALVMYERYGRPFLLVTMRVVLLAVVVQVALSFVYFGTRTVRGTIFFNNPNQLGYYALVSACMIALGQRTLRYNIVHASVGLVGCMYLALLSASKAGVAGTVMLFALTIITNPRVIIAIAFATAGLLAIGGPVARAVDTTQHRMGEDRRPEWSFFEERGYDRIEKHKEHLIFGAGEGATTRFADTGVIGTHEIHSSAATVLFAYGIPGVVLFLAFLWRVVQGASLRLAMILLPALAYTIAHQGLRFTSLWVLLGLFIVAKQLPLSKVPTAGIERRRRPRARFAT